MHLLPVNPGVKECWKILNKISMDSELFYPPTGANGYNFES